MLVHGSDGILTNAQYLAADIITACGNGIWVSQDVTCTVSDITGSQCH